LDPRPTEASIHLAYQRYYTHSFKESISREEHNPIRRFLWELAKGYLNNRYGSHFTPAKPVGSRLISLVPPLQELLDRRLRYLPKLQHGMRLLDVGFGSGAFLELAQEVGWEVLGADTDPITVENALERGLNVRQGGVESFSDMKEQFDAITLSHVIEHVHEPRALIKAIFDLLKPGGWLYLDTPNIEALGHQRFGIYWRGLESPRHLIIFSWGSMSKLLTHVGFSDIVSKPAVSPYASLNAASRTMAAGLDPYQHNKISMGDRFNSIMAGVRTLMNHRHSEFITMMARKPINERIVEYTDEVSD
jgi:2-polyprenyl-3-methyl-5-hydroxy-6-metoxy-1,4-benzoquinol methylase